MTLLVKPSTTAVAKASDDDPFLAYAKAGGGAIVGELLKFAKGDYLAGQDSREIPIGTRLIANMDTLETGWVRWMDGRPSEHRMGLVAEHFTPAWRKDLDPSDGKIYTFSTSSVGGRNALRDLCTDYAHGRRQHPNEHPVIELGVDSYQHSNKQLGRIKTPTFVIVGWYPKDSVELQPSPATGNAPRPQLAAPAREEAPPWPEHPGDPGPDFSDQIPW